MEKVVQGKLQSHCGKGQGDEEKGLVKNVGTTITERSVEAIRKAAIVGHCEPSGTTACEQIKRVHIYGYYASTLSRSFRSA